MKKKILLGVLLAAAMLTFNACGSRTVTRTTENGLKYKVWVKGEGRAAQMGDIVEGVLTLSSQDSVLFALEQPEKLFQVMESNFPGDLNEGLALVHEGDSVSFYVPLDSIAKYMGGGFPDFVKEYLVYSVRVDKLYTEAELREAENLATAEAKEIQEAAIAEYLRANNLNVTPDESGIYFILEKKGRGDCPKPGQYVRANYIGRLLNGKIFDTSLEDVAKENGVYMPQRPYEPLGFATGVGQMIPGFDLAIQKMNVGAKAKVILPFELAYGNRQVNEDIPPYSTLVFDIELVEIQ